MNTQPAVQSPHQDMRLWEGSPTTIRIVQLDSGNGDVEIIMPAHSMFREVAVAGKVMRAGVTVADALEDGDAARLTLSVFELVPCTPAP